MCETCGVMAVSGPEARGDAGGVSVCFPEAAAPEAQTTVKH